MCGYCREIYLKPSINQYANEKDFGLNDNKGILCSYKNADLIKIIKVTEKVRIVYLVMNFDKLPAYAVMELYKNPLSNREIITSFSWNTKIFNIVPPIYLD